MTINPRDIRINERIRAREVRVIDGTTNAQLGVMRTDEAIRRARSMGLDLIEVAATAQPPVCKILNFGKYRYELAKLSKDKKQTETKTKEVKFRANIDEHDYLTKIRHAEEFLDKGCKVKLYLFFRGREMAHQDLGVELMKRISLDLATMGHTDNTPKVVGRGITIYMTPLAENKRIRKFSRRDEVIVPEDENEDAEDHEDNEHEADESEE